MYGGRVRRPKVLTMPTKDIFGFWAGIIIFLAAVSFRELPRASGVSMLGRWVRKPIGVTLYPPAIYVF